MDTPTSGQPRSLADANETSRRQAVAQRDTRGDRGVRYRKRRARGPGPVPKRGGRRAGGRRASEPDEALGRYASRDAAKIDEQRALLSECFVVDTGVGGDEHDRVGAGGCLVERHAVEPELGQRGHVRIVVSELRAKRSQLLDDRSAGDSRTSPTPVL